MIVAIELRPEPGGTEDGNAVELANRRGPAMYRTAPERGVLLRPLGDVLFWMPPYCIHDEQHPPPAGAPGAATAAASCVAEQWPWPRTATWEAASSAEHRRGTEIYGSGNSTW